MKKITFFATLLAMLVSSVQSAFADDAKWTGKGIKSVDAAVTSLSNLTDGYYLVRNVGHSTFLQEQGNGNLYLWNANNYSSDLTSINNAFSGDATNMNSVVYLAKDSEDGTYTMQFKSGKYMPAFGSGGTTSNATAAKLTVAIYNEGESYFNFKDGNNYADGKGGDIHGQGNGAGNFVGWKDLSDKNGNNSYQFYKVTLDDVLTVNYKYTVAGHVVLAVNSTRTKGLAPSADAYPCLTITGYDKQTITESGDVVVNCTMALPVEASTVAAPKWYAVRMHNGKRMMVADAANSEVACNDVELSLPELPDANQWAFVGNDLLTSFKLYNKGTQKYLKTSAKNAISTLVDEADATEFHVMATKIKDMENGFCISNSSWYLNYQNPNTGTDKAPKYDKPGVYGWHDNDQGSTCTVYAPESFPLNYAASFANVPEGAIGGPQYLENAENLKAYKAAYNKANGDASEANINALVDINKQIAASPVGTTLTEGYYRLVNCKDKNYLHINGTILNDQAGKEKAIGSVVYFKNTETEGQYSVLVEGKYLGAVTRSTDVNLGEEANKGTYTVTSNNFISSVHEVSNNNDTDYRYLHVNNGNAVGWEANTPASQWYIIPATDVEIDMTAQGDKKYASAYLPFSVSAVDGATAYVGALNAEKTAIDMKGVSGVPANTGFVLVGNGNKATLTIGNAAAIEGDNALTGTNTGVTFADATPRANYLVFGVNNDKVGFYTPSNSVPAIPANKAYINASAVTGSAIALNFGNTVTGINAATIINGENNAPIYDLSGRRVWAPVKGGLYIQNGKKIIK
ncbi:hypothetical protein [uncultured Prevotellamassilia sp.]|uniref:hypothetical protein n=1 Tax=uncultured Prevotellamassilia sp. TaxID=1926676 RepID=UPI00258D24C8|nr:hypothetical protein [uncultured Prevotellamassilia sp.]